MEFLSQERVTLAGLLPGLDELLAEQDFDVLESDRSNAIELFRDAGGAGLVVPSDFHGLGASAFDAVRVQRAIGSRSPSLAVATTMHHFSAATMIELWKIERGFEWMLLQAVADQKMLLASGFAEGVSGQSIFRPTMRGRRENGSVIVSGTKKPCSLSRSMDLLTASVMIDSADGEGEFAIALIPANLPGVTIEPFWGAPVLRGAESDAVIVEEVRLDGPLVVSIDTAVSTRLDGVQAVAFAWFELLITASYLGMASALAERVLKSERSGALQRLAPAVELESAMASLEATARLLDEGDASSAVLTRAVLCRYAAQDAINRAVAQSVELLGGVAFIESGEVAYYAACTQALAFHPPGRQKNAEATVAALRGEALEMS
ncbi:MAG: acyl-CoA dehydrogenase [Solirubrobacterales bacterium]